MAKRTKTVFSDVFHVWAQQAHDIGKNPGGNRSFKGEFAFSYVEPIARIVTVHGQKIALHRDYSFSVTTSKMQSEARRATSHYPSFHVRHIGGSSNWENGYNSLAVADDGINHRANLAHYSREILLAAGKVRKARSSAGWNLQTLDGIVAQANKYAEVFGLRTRFESPSDIDRAEIRQRVERAKARADELNRTKEERDKARRAAQQLADVEQFNKWLAGEAQFFPSSYRRYSTGATDYLRVQGENVQTSQGAIVPLSHVLRALPIVLRYVSRGLEFAPTDKTIHLGNYQLHGIDSDGTVIIGCHRVSKAELMRFIGTLPANWDVVQA